MNTISDVLKAFSVDWAAALVAAFDATGVHRASTSGDAASGAWLCDEAVAAGAAVARSPVPLDRTVVRRACFESGPLRIDGLPMFDAPPVAELRGRLVACGEDGEFGYLELPPNAASIKGQPFETIRRTTHHAALLVATRVGGESLAPVNAQFFPGTLGPPVLQVAGMHHERLAMLARERAPGAIACAYAREPAQSFNVVAEVPGAAPLLMATPRTGWWESTAERAGGIVAWLAGLTVAAARQRPLRAFATCGHELGHVGLRALLAQSPELTGTARCWLHLGANLGCASNRTLFVRAHDPAQAARMRELLAGEGYPGEHIRVEPAAKLSGEGHDLARDGAQVLSLTGTNAHFHAASDRWPANVDAAGVAAIARAVGAWIAEQPRG